MECKFIEEKKEKFKVTQQDINTIEEQYDIIFPEYLKEFYLEYNGATIKLCKIFVDGYMYGISEMIQLKYGECNFEYILEGDREDKIIPFSMIPIANNEGGDYYYLDMEDGKIYLFFCDDIENPIYICENIESLFKLMNESCA